MFGDGRDVVAHADLDVRPEVQLIDQLTSLIVAADVELIRIDAHPGTHARPLRHRRLARRHDEQRGQDDHTSHLTQHAMPQAFISRKYEMPLRDVSRSEKVGNDSCGGGPLGPPCTGP
jgi:hypothetical protein